MQLRADKAEVSIHATALNFGPAFGAVAMALGARDTATVRAIAGPTRVMLAGEAIREGAAEDHPTIVSLRYLLERVGAPEVGIHLHYDAQIPPHSGLGSWTAQILLGLLAGRELVGAPDWLTNRDLADLAVGLGTDPLRVNASLSGTMALTLPSSTVGEPPTFLSVPVGADLSPVGFVPGMGSQLPLQVVREPRVVEFPRAFEAIARVGSLVALLSGSATVLSEEDLAKTLMEATHDELRESECEVARPASWALVQWLRGLGLPAFLSGAGPAVVCLVPVSREIIGAAERSGWRVFDLGVA